MKSTLYYGVLIVFIVVTGGVVYEQYQDSRPCVSVIAITTGDIDARFEIKQSVLIAKVEAAADTWNQAAGRTLFVYDESAGIPVNLVYDEREATAKLGLKIAERQIDQDAARAVLEKLQAQFATKQELYNQKVAAINARGGASRKEAVELDRERSVLTSASSPINLSIASYNATVASLNAAVEEFNKTAGRTFEQGQYVRDADGERINIFAFTSSAQLERVLAHEFGHALGLAHNDDPDAIMYAKNESGNLVPTATDTSALKALCGT